MQRRGRECGRPRWRSGGGKKQGGPNEVGSLVRTPVHPSTVQHDQKSASKGVRNATRCDGRTTDAPAHRPTVLREDGGVMPTEHRPERDERRGGGENATAARSWLPISQPTPAALISLGGTAAVAGGPKGTTREAGLLPPRTEKKRRSLTLPSSDFEL